MAMLPEKLKEAELDRYKQISKCVRNLLFVIVTKDGLYYTREPIPADKAAVEKVGLSAWLETKKDLFTKLDVTISIGEPYMFHVAGVETEPELWLWDRILGYLDAGKIKNPIVIDFLFILLCDFYYRYECMKYWGLYHGTE